jgi:hypothetical protein
MIDFNDVRYITLTKESLLRQYSEYDIFRHYLGDFTLGQTYKSPLRRGDDTPSFNVFYSKQHNCLLFKDFAGKRGDFIRFVQELYSLPTYQEALQKIVEDMPLSYSISEQPKAIPEHVSTEKGYEIKIVVRPFEQKDINFWQQFGISIPTLRFFDVLAISAYYHSGFYMETKDLAYAYLEYKDHKLTYKIYRPTAKKRNKWRNNHPAGVHDGYRQLPNSGELLLITKSRKDVMSLYECAHIPAVGIQSETCFMKQSVVDEYALRFDRVLTLFDNDIQGRNQAKAYYNTYRIDPIFIPDHFRRKDFSDLLNAIGPENATEVLNNLLIN